MLATCGDFPTDTIASKKMAEGRRCRRTWHLAAVVEYLRCVCSRLALSLLMESTTAPNRTAWATIAAAMVAKGYPRSWVQVWVQVEG